MTSRFKLIECGVERKSLKVYSVFFGLVRGGSRDGAMDQSAATCVR